ncbi:MAG TPA: GNAT family N-acetyltransferase [Solirubrobacteraceae bacterium]
MPEDVAMVLDDLLTGSARLVLNPGPVTGAAWAAAPAQARVRHDVHIVDLREGYDALWSSDLSSDTRNKVRKAQKRGVEVQWGLGTELMQVHWEIFLRWTTQRARESGIPVPLAIALARRRESLVGYETIARHLGERCQVVVARVGGQPAASVIGLLDGVHAHYWRAASDQAVVRRRYANHLLVARILERASARGCQYVHMGESGGKRSLIQFKEHFGAKPVSYEELRFGPVTVTKTVRAGEHLLRRAEILAARGAARLRRISPGS